ncbi:calmodulin-binding carboxy-terminal kinesin-like family protein [Cyclospora cayetanensis]|uniref:Calmodulin-binding carboxy-terminal kinesin-like family protein n=1 Tax=Cyclospora cayetanensis TaxID=88456 RepID=A0A1D3D0E7_9EIME|nr:calmodulin-binding carboxy-terminal kinesin-like family protein [Cyclospora cayetanensis]
MAVYWESFNLNPSLPTRALHRSGEIKSEVVVGEATDTDYITAGPAPRVSDLGLEGLGEAATEAPHPFMVPQGSADAESDHPAQTNAQEDAFPEVGLPWASSMGVFDAGLGWAAPTGAPTGLLEEESSAKGPPLEESLSKRGDEGEGCSLAAAREESHAERVTPMRSPQLSSSGDPRDSVALNSPEGEKAQDQEEVSLVKRPSKGARFAETPEEVSLSIGVETSPASRTVKVLISDKAATYSDGISSGRKSIRIPNMLAQEVAGGDGKMRNARWLKGAQLSRLPVCGLNGLDDLEVPRKKIEVVSFSEGRVVDSAVMAREGLVVTDKKSFIPTEAAKAYISSLIQEFDRQLATMQEMEWHFRMVEDATRRRAAKQVETLRRTAVSKCTMLLKKLQSTKARLEFYEQENNELHKNFEERVQEFKEQMPKTMQELDAQWQGRIEELRDVIFSSQSELEVLKEQQDDLMQNLEEFMSLLGAHVPEVSSVKQKVEAFAAALRGKLQQHQQQDIKFTLSLMIERVVVQTLEKQLKAAKEERSAVALAATHNQQAETEERGSLYHEAERSHAGIAALQASLAAGGGAGTGTAAGRKLSEGELQEQRGIRELEERLQALSNQVQALKDENHNLQIALVSMEEVAKKGESLMWLEECFSACAGGRAQGGGGAGIGASTVQILNQAKEKNKQLEQQVAALQKKLKECEAARAKGGSSNNQQMKALELQLKEAEADKRRELKLLEQKLTKSSEVSAPLHPIVFVAELRLAFAQGAAADAKKLEAQLHRQTERAEKAESQLGSATSELKDVQAKYDALAKEFADLQKQLADVQGLTAEVLQLQATAAQQSGMIKELEASYQAEKKLRKKYYNEIEDMKGKIRVFCRVRPFAKYEVEKGCSRSVEVIDEYSVKVAAPKGEKEFTYDRVFSGESTQEEVYEDTERLIQSVIDGFNVSVRAPSTATATWPSAPYCTPRFHVSTIVLIKLHDLLYLWAVLYYGRVFTSKHVGSVSSLWGRTSKHIE